MATITLMCRNRQTVGILARLQRTLPVALLVGLGGSATAEVPAWPLPLPDRFLTSNFMEYRNGRFHTGLDLKTNSESGYAVFAAEDGWVVRLRTSPYGYGRAVYLEGISGRTYVYAHLERFADRLRPLVRRAQARNHRYDVDLYLAEERIPVGRGEVIALSGQSGTAGPHVHFEVRNADQQPINPLHGGFVVPDTIPPQIHTLRAIPASPVSRVAGRLVAHSIADRQGLAGHLPPLTLRGPVAFTAEISDTADRTRHRLTPYELIVRLDGAVVFQASNDSLAFSQNHQMLLEWLEMPGVREKWLYRRPGNSLPGRIGESWSVTPPGLSPGVHRANLEVRDHAGNRAAVDWEILVLGEPAAVWPAQVDSADFAQAAAGIQPLGEGSVTDPRKRREWREDPVRIELPSTPDGHQRWLTPFLVVVRDTTAGTEIAHRATTYPTLPADRVLLTGREADPGGQTVLWVAPDSLTREAVMAAQLRQGLNYQGLAVTVLGIDRYNWRHPVITLPLPVSLPDTGWTAGVYLQNAEREWRHVESPVQVVTSDSGRVWQIPVPAPGRLAIFRDTEPPIIGPAGEPSLETHLTAMRSQAGVTLPYWRPVSIPLVDRGAGVDPQTVRGWFDGQEIVLEPDPIRDRVLLELADDIPPGDHDLVLLAGDYAKNTSLRNLTLTCREGP